MGEVGNVWRNLCLDWRISLRLARARLEVGGENTFSFFSFIDSLNSVSKGLEKNVHLAISSSSVNFSRHF